VYGAFLQGHNVHGVEFEQDLILVMGSESHGISDRVAKQITRNITIPSFGHAESLNVAMATGIILDNIKRVNS
jgi:TrmH family RNA methyltransferase